MLPKVRIVGKDPTGKSVVCGIFKLFDTSGLPLFVIFDLCQRQNWLPSWIHFYRESKSAGWTHKTIIDRLKEGMEDVYEPEFVNTVLKRLNTIYTDA